MKILLLLLVLGLLVAPVLAALPRPEQRRRERLRQTLMERGVSVRLGLLPGMKLQKMSAAGSAAARCSVPLSGPAFAVPCLALREGDGWRIQGALVDPARRRLQRVLQTFPAAVEAVEVTAHDAAAYWREQGTERDAEQLRRGLSELQNLCAPENQT